MTAHQATAPRAGGSHDDIAVVGMALQYPGASTLAEFWANVLARRQQFRTIPDERMPLSMYYSPDPKAPDLTYGSRGAFIDGWSFDLVRHKINKSSFETTDMAHWLALDVAGRALRDAGYEGTVEAALASRTGCVVGNTLTGDAFRSNLMRLRWPHVRRALEMTELVAALPPQLAADFLREAEAAFKDGFPPTAEDFLSGNLSNTIAGRICNHFDLGAGGYVVDGACASSLLAICQGASALAHGDMDMCVVGGVDLSIDPFEIIGFAKTRALTPDEMRVYDARGNGFIPGEGCGFVVLKRMADALAAGDRVYARIDGWSISSDGKSAITAPKAPGQARAIGRAYERTARVGRALGPVRPSQVSFVEGHGTGTRVGDRVELKGQSIVFAQDDAVTPRHTGMTSLKSILGHCKAAAGIGAFIKTVMGVNRRILPPTAGCETVNPFFCEPDGMALYPLRHGVLRMPDAVLHAGVSAMGFGGINTHVLVSSPDVGPAAELALPDSVDERAAMVSHQASELFCFVAASLPDLVEQLRDWAVQARDIAVAEMVDLAKYLADRVAGAEAPAFRAAVVASSPRELADELVAFADGIEDEFFVPGELIRRGPNKFVACMAMGASPGAPSVAEEQPRVGFVYPGQGSQAAGMARMLVERFSWAREVAQQLSPKLLRAAYPELNHIVDEEGQRAANALLSGTDMAQPTICLASILWTMWLERLGVSPAAVAGHSLGELSAFFAAGKLDAASVLELATLRGRLMADLSSDSAMIALGCDSTAAQGLLLPLLQGAEGRDEERFAALANINSFKQVVVACLPNLVQPILEAAAASGIRGKRLAVSNGFHSELVRDAANELRTSTVALTPRKNPSGAELISSVTATGHQVAPTMDHFATHVMHQVDFISIARRVSNACDVILEVGPGRVLTRLCEDILGSTGPHHILPLEASPNDASHVLAAGMLFVRGFKLNLDLLFESRVVRPFIRPADKQFIVNPAERAAIARARRGEVRKTAIPDMPPLKDALNGHAPSTKPAASTAMLSKTDSERPLIERLIELAESFTGFPKGHITASSTFGDDLSMDSIKASDFMAAASASVNIATEADVADMIDVSAGTLGDLAAVLQRLMPAEVPPPTTQPPVDHNTPLVSIQRWLVTRCAEITGFPEQNIGPESRLLDDLSFESIKAADFIDEASRFIGCDAGAVSAAAENDANMTLEALSKLLHMHQTHRSSMVQFFIDKDKTTSASSSRRASAMSIGAQVRSLGLVETRGLHTAAAAAAPASVERSAKLDDLLEHILARTENITGFPRSAFGAASTLLDDLNMDSIKSVDFIASLSADMEVASTAFDAGDYANATLAELASVFSKHGARVAVERPSALLPSLPAAPPTASLAGSPADTSPGFTQAPSSGFSAPTPAPAPTQSPAPSPQADSLVQSLSKYPDWVRGFAMRYRREPLSAADFNVDSQRILCITDEKAVMAPLLTQLMLQGATVTVTPWAEARARATGEVNHVLALLPATAYHGDLTETTQASCEMLLTLATVTAAAARGERRLTVIAPGQALDTDGSLVPSLLTPCLSAIKSIHLETPRACTRLIVTAGMLDYAHLLRELANGGAFSESFYDEHLERYAPKADLVELECLPARHIEWCDDDVIVVTGGGKGITAECVLQLSRTVRTRYALVGSSPASAATDRTLELLRSSGVRAEYFCCDVADYGSVTALVDVITFKLGPPTALIHGAGRNANRLARNTRVEDALNEMGPKQLGMYNLLAAIPTPLRFIAALTSIIGVSGMAGNAWYAYANASVEFQCASYRHDNPNTQTVCIAYSVWDDVGMGARMGSVAKLAKLGIGAIAPAEGIAHFVNLTLGNPAASTVVVTARVAGLATWPTPALRPSAIYVDADACTGYPGIELLTRTRITYHDDPYVLEHVYKGTALFATVFGLEAMAQAAVALVPEDMRCVRRIEAVKLERPLIVTDKGLVLESYARVRVQEYGAEPGTVVVECELRASSSSFRAPHFSAVFVLGAEPGTAAAVVPTTTRAPLDIVPREDLYGGILFQQGRFQKMDAIYALSDKSVTCGVSADAYDDRRQSILGDPFCRDVLLQSTAVLCSRVDALPVRIDSIEFNGPPQGRPGARRVHTDLLSLHGKDIQVRVVSTDAKTGDVLEVMHGYTCRVLSERPTFPSALQLVNASASDERRVQELVPEGTGVILRWERGFSRLVRAERHVVEQRLLQQRLGAELSWVAGSDKPHVSISGREVPVSITHSGDYLVVMHATAPIGCDLERVSTRTLAQWRAILPACAHGVLESATAGRARGADTLDLLGTQLWSALEAHYKLRNVRATNVQRVDLADSAVLRVQVNGDFVTAWPLQMTRAGRHVFALAG